MARRLHKFVKGVRAKFKAKLNLRSGYPRSGAVIEDITEVVSLSPLLPIASTAGHRMRFYSAAPSTVRDNQNSSVQSVLDLRIPGAPAAYPTSCTSIMRVGRTRRGRRRGQ